MRVYCDKDCPQKENVKQMFANSTVLILQKCQTPIFGAVTPVVLGDEVHILDPLVAQFDQACILLSS